MAYPLQIIPLVDCLFQKRMFLAIFISVCAILFHQPAFATEEKPTKQCQWLISSLILVDPHLAKVANEAKDLSVKVGKLGYDWAKAKVTDESRITPDEYEKLRNRKVGEYFSKGKVTKEKVDKFYEDFEKVANNFGRMQLGDAMFFKKKLPKEKERAEHWTAVRDDVMKYGFVAREKDKTLEQLLMDQHFEHSRPEEKPLLSEQIKKFAKEAPWLPLVATKKSAFFILGESKWAFRTAVLGGTLSVMLALFTDPINNNIATFMNDHFGHVGTQMQLWFSDLRAARQKLARMVEVKDQMKEVDRLYQMNEMSEADAMAAWRKLEETFLRYAQEMNSVVPNNVASGRSYFRDGNIMNPLAFVTAASSVQSEILGYEAAVRDFERTERMEGLLSPDQKEKLETSRARLALAKKRMGGVLAAVKVHEMIYPELTRSKFQKEKSANEFFQGYKVLMGAMHLEDYSSAYVDEMDAVLKQFSITLNHLDKK